jgi:hypothetical protein
MLLRTGEQRGASAPGAGMTMVVAIETGGTDKGADDVLLSIWESLGLRPEKRSQHI